MPNNIENQQWFNNKQVMSLVGFVAFSVFYLTYFYFSTEQQSIKHKSDMKEIRDYIDLKTQHLEGSHGADIEALEIKQATIEDRLQKKIKVLYEVEDRVVALEK